PAYIYEYDPVGQTFTDVTPSGLGGENAFELNMLLLPTGQVLLGNEAGGFQVYTPDGAPQAAWRPTITSIAVNAAGTFTLTGTQLNCLNEGASYGDDLEMASNYPIVRLTAPNGQVSFAKTFNWSSTAVATGTTPVSTQFTLPPQVGPGVYSLSVIANGIASNP